MPERFLPGEAPSGLGAGACAPPRAKATFGSVISPPARAVPPLCWQAVNGLASPNTINPAANENFEISFRMRNDSRTTPGCKPGDSAAAESPSGSQSQLRVRPLDPDAIQIDADIWQPGVLAGSSSAAPCSGPLPAVCSPPPVHVPPQLPLRQGLARLTGAASGASGQRFPSWALG